MPIQTRFLAREQTRHAGAVAASTVAVALCAALLAGCSSGPTMGAYGAPSAAALMQAQQNDEEKAKLAKPDTRELYLSMIRQVQDQGSYFASLAHIEQFRMQFGSAPDVDILRADALRETGQPDAAEQAYRQLLGSTEAAAAWHGLGLVSAQRKDYAGATQALREAVSRAPTQAFYLSDLGFALLRNGEPAAARVPLAQAAELQPDSKKVLSNLAVYLLVTGDRSRADAMMTNAKMSPSTREAIDKLAADIRAQTKARKQAADAAAARAAAQAAAAIAPQAAPVLATASASAESAASARVSASSEGPVVVRLPQASASNDGQNKVPSKPSQVASASDAKLARAGDGPRSDMPTSMLDRFAHSQ
ncbi:tetratricopeptide repeat protein [Pandoraea commovens]|uniref:Pilus assembly protein n=1 Tax=Pandoraea commovens TaxID=2508289 RepID=A0ABY5QCF1_9BURK|nr:pilus assembly protein [Pandoraea commovens]UVA77588.1 pilus assembly protein [Pandoraea commovens]